MQMLNGRIARIVRELNGIKVFELAKHDYGKLPPFTAIAQT